MYPPTLFHADFASLANADRIGRSVEAAYPENVYNPSPD